MRLSPSSLLPLVLFSALLCCSLSCGKGGSTPPPPNPCAGVTVSVTGTVTHPSAPGLSNGAISVSATGGSGFTYTLNGGAAQSSGSFTGLPQGSYTVVAKNGNGCTGTSNFTLVDANPCSGVTITVSGTTVNPTGPGASNGSISATGSGGTGPYTFSINGGAFQASGTFTGLPAGSHSVTAKDANGCSGAATFTLTAPNPCAGVSITVSGTVTNPTAAGSGNGAIAATAAGGTGPYTFSLNSGAFQSSGSFNGLNAGNHTITAKDANGCTGSAPFTLTVPNPCAGVTITVSPTVVNNTPCTGTSNGSITVTASGGNGTYTYSLNGGAFQASGVFSNLAAAVYSVTAKDGNGCTGTNNSINVGNQVAGPLFSAVRTVLQNNCVSCHNPSQANGGMDWTVDCNIVANKDRVKARAVDANPSAMPPTGLLPASERQKITNWINAGGRYTD